MVESGVEIETTSSGIKNYKLLNKGIRRRLRNDKDVLVVVTGEEGSGKSVLGITFCRDLDPSFKMSRNVLFDPKLDELHGLIYELPPESSILVDELVRVGYSRNWQSNTNKVLNELYMLCRNQRKASFMCIPRFKAVDSDVRARCLFWVHVVERGLAVVLRKDKNQFAPDPWRLVENEKLLLKAFKGKPVHFFSAEEYVTAISKSPNYVTFIEFNDLEPGLKAEYLSSKKPFELKPIGELKHNELVERYRRALALVYNELLGSGWTLARVSKLTGFDISAISRTVNKFVEKRVEVKDFGVKPPEAFDELKNGGLS